MQLLVKKRAVDRYNKEGVFMDKRKILIIVFSILIIIVISLLFLYDDPAAYKKNYGLENFGDNKVYDVNNINNCLIVGNICTDEEVRNGIEVVVSVNDNKQLNFHVIDNDEYTATLLADENIMLSEWANDNNFYGPINALLNLYNETSSWDRIENNVNFEYEDTSYAVYKSYCVDKTNEKPDYFNCNEIGYESISILEGKATINNNPMEEEKKYEFKDELIARLITLEEVTKFYDENYELPLWLSDNLSDNDAYWTLSSSNDARTNYTKGAFAIVRADNKTQFVSANIEKDDFYEVGIRPVISIYKYVNQKSIEEEE